MIRTRRQAAAAETRIAVGWLAPQWFGSMIASRRSDPSLSVWNRLSSDSELEMTSDSFEDGHSLPARFAAKGVGENISPSFSWSAVPSATRSLVFVLEDLDVPIARPLMHMMSLIPSERVSLPENALALASDSVRHVKGPLGLGYRGPRPIVGHGPPRYQFMLFAVDDVVDGTSSEKALDSMVGHVRARGRITGTYER